MTLGAKMEYLETIAGRYRKASRKQKSAMLNEFCATCGYHCKHAIRALRRFKRFAKSKRKKTGNPPRYTHPELIRALQRIWLTAHLPCASRLKAILPLWIDSYEQEFSPLPDHIRTQIQLISSSTINRLLSPIRIRYRGHGRSLTKPGSLLRHQIPVKTNQGDEFRPGFIEADSVHHCGDSTDGQYAITVNYTDIATSWTEQRAVWGKGQHDVFRQTKNVEQSLPFPIRGFDADNGGEFLNEHLYRYFTNRQRDPVQFTRSRAYKKDDNAHIEQKNWTHVRQWIGYQRFDNPKTVPLLNDLYTGPWRLFHNFFLPSVKLIEKKRIAAKFIKRYDTPQTPYPRIINAADIPDEVKQKLQKQMKYLNPFHIKKIIVAKIDALHRAQQKFNLTKTGTGKKSHAPHLR